MTSKTLKLLVTNAFGIRSKFGEFQHTLLASDADIAVVTETKLTLDKMTQAEVTLPGYSPPVRRDRTPQGGGVAVWVKSHLAFQELEAVPTLDQEVVWLSIRIRPGRKVVLCAAYRPGSLPGNDISMVDYLDQTIDVARVDAQHLIIAGDFNAHNTAWLGSSRTTPAGEKLEDLCALHHLQQHVTEPTRGNALLDLIMSDLGNPTVRLGPPIGRSDHATILAEFKTELCREPKTARTVWQYGRADWDRLNYHLRSVDWDALMSEDANSSCTNITSAILDGMNQFIPSQLLCTRPSDPAWWTPACSKAVKAKQSAWKSLKRRPDSPQCQANYTLAVHRSSDCLRDAQNHHLAIVRARLQTGSLRDKQWWSTIKQSIGTSRNSSIPILVDPAGKEHATNIEKANCLGHYFAEKCSLGANDLPDTPLPPIRLRTGNRLKTVHFRPATVQRALKNLDASKATGPDGIPAQVL
ncbi:uncharacterized protein LOC135813361 [Sycon ciliatum]|uniref:uncharacterized protein LOC135813361 n=1 Tax=Sycon ciliatum TaxID=27933 RepID=UPI0031F699EB